MHNCAEGKTVAGEAIHNCEMLQLTVKEWNAHLCHPFSSHQGVNAQLSRMIFKE